MEKLLFICTFNQNRSQTAEWVFNKMKGVEARSGGTSRSARKKINPGDLEWADTVFVMEEEQKQNILDSFGKQYREKVKVLGIPDDYSFMDQALQQLLVNKVHSFLPNLVRS